jgi:hypothetical protein
MNYFEIERIKLDVFKISKRKGNRKNQSEK